MDWIEVAMVGVDGEAAEALSEVMARFGQGGAVIEKIVGTADSTAPIEHPLIVKTYLPDEPQTPAKIQKLREVIWHLHVIYPMPEPQVRRLAQTDWAEAWKEHYTRIKPGKRLVIVPAWEEEPVEPSDLPIRMDPGMAFGTGTHPSTQLCLILMEKYVKQGDRVFDVGTGSGILSIAAAHLQAGSIVATDIDPIAVKATQENVLLNEVQNVITVKEGSVDAFDGPFDLIVINILAEIIAGLLPDAVARLAPNGHLLLAGIIAEHESLVQEKIAEWGLRVVERLNHGDWIGLAVARKEIARR